MRAIQAGDNVYFTKSFFKSNVADTALVRKKFVQGNKVIFEVKTDNGFIFCVDDDNVLLALSH